MTDTRVAYRVMEGRTWGKDKKPAGTIVLLTPYEAAPIEGSFVERVDESEPVTKPEKEIEVLEKGDEFVELFGPMTARALYSHGVTSVAALRRMTDREILRVKGIAESRLADIREKVGWAEDNEQLEGLAEEHPELVDQMIQEEI